MANPTREEANKTRSSTRRKLKTPPITEMLSNAGETISNTVSATTNVIQDISTNVDAVAANFKGLEQTFTQRSTAITQPSNTSYQEAIEIASRFGIVNINPIELLGSNPYLADAQIPLMDAKDANEQKMIIQKQNNSLSVRNAKIDQNRKVAQLVTENSKLIGDAVKLSTAQIEVGTNFLENQIADTNYQTKQSKLEQSNQYLEQQQLATQGTINLTPLIKEEWLLKFQKLEIKNQNTRLQIQGALRENEITTQMLEAKLLEL